MITHERTNLVLPKVYVAGHNGMVGSALMRLLLAAGHTDDNLVVRTKSELDLKDRGAVSEFFKREKPDQVYLAAAKVGGIHANNTYPAEFILDNLLIQANVIDAAFKSGVKKLLFLGSSCIYPKISSQPISEDSLLAGKLEPTNEPYAIAKIAGLKLCESYNRQYGKAYGVDYRSIMPTNLYGLNDNYHPEDSHVIPALIRRIHEAKVGNAKKVKIWGTGLPRREFLYVDDLARAAIHIMSLSRAAYESCTRPSCSHINVGYGSDLTIKELAEIIKKTVGFHGEIVFDSTMPDGAPKKLIDSTLINSLGWRPETCLEIGLKLAYANFLQRETSNA